MRLDERFLTFSPVVSVALLASFNTPSNASRKEKKSAKRSKTTRAALTLLDDDDGVDQAEKTQVSGKSKGASDTALAQSAEQLFDTYVEGDNSHTLGLEGLQRLCGDANIPMDGACPLLLAWQLDAKEFGLFSRDEWTAGLNALQITSLDALSSALVDLEDLIVLRNPPPAKPTAQSISKGIKSRSAPPPIEKYNKNRYWSYATDVVETFSKFYSFCFGLVKKEGSRNIDMEYACAFWSVILSPTYPIMKDIIDFINEKGTYRAVNKDLWSMMSEFCRSVSPSLEDYDSEGAWPTLLDDFVEWKKAQTSLTTSKSDGAAT